MIVSEKMAREAHATLDIYTDFNDPAMDAELVQVSYRIAAKATHPDAGGTPEAFAAVDRAKHVLLAWLAKQAEQPAPAHKKRPCDYCGGAGYVITSSGKPGAPGLRRQCQKCHGSGDADYDAT